MPAKGSPDWHRERRDPRPVSAEELRAAQAAMVHEERRQFLELLREIVATLDTPGQPPGHNHKVPAVWDDGRFAGMSCQWCETWNRAKRVLARYPA